MNSNDPGRVRDPSELADELAIRQVLAAHSRGVDRADGDILRSCYWDDATVSYGGPDGPASAFCDVLPGAIRGYARTAHVIGNVLIDLRGSEARVETYVTAYHYRSVADGPDREMIYIGRYLDRMQRRDGVWRISHRTALMDWNRNVDASAIWSGPPFDGLARGARAPDDPSCAFF